MLATFLLGETPDSMSNTGYNKNRRVGDSGFTLIEMLIVVAMVAILAGVAVVAYQRHLRSGRIVQGREFIAAIQAREETYYQQHGTYVTTNGTDFYPGLVTNEEPSVKPWTTPPAGWISLGARPPEHGTTFAYLVVASTGPNHALDATATALQIPQVAGGMTPQPWYYVIAHADLDGNATYANGGCGGTVHLPTDCTVMTATSARSTIVAQNEGQ